MIELKTDEINLRAEKLEREVFIEMHLSRKGGGGAKVIKLALNHVERRV